MKSAAQTPTKVREGLMLCMMLASAMDGRFRREETREMAQIIDREEEFAGETWQEFESLLARAQLDLHRNPERLMDAILDMLPEEATRRRGLEFATRVAVSDGFVTEDEAALLQRLAERMGLGQGELRTIVASCQLHLVRLMMLYLVSLTALADGTVNPVEYEQMLPIVLRQPAFAGVSTEDFAALTKSVRDNLPAVSSEWGVDYVAGTLRKAAELLDDPSITHQALKVVTSGVLADEELRESERAFILRVAETLGLESTLGEEIMATTVRESKEIGKLG